jgi:hypothetical protein
MVWIVVVDSFCRDGTDDYLRAKHDPFIKVHDIGKGCGVGVAYRRGIKHALSLGADHIIEVDVGHPVDKIPEFQYWLHQVPVVMGNRYAKNGGFIDTPLKRRFISKIGTWIAQLFLGLPYSDCTSGFQGFHSQVARNLPDRFMSSGHFYQTEFKYYCKRIPFHEIGFVYVGNTSSISRKAIWESIRTLFSLRRRDVIHWRR